MAAQFKFPNRYVLISTISALVLTGCGGGGGGGGGDNPTVRTSSTYNLNGDWILEERFQTSTCANITGETYTDIYRITQDNDNVTVTNENQTVMSGVLDSSLLKLQGIYTNEVEQYRVTTSVSATVTSNDRFTGGETLTISSLETDEECTLQFYLTATRGSTLPEVPEAPTSSDSSGTVDTTPDGDTPDFSEALPLESGVAVTSNVNSAGNHFAIYRLDVNAGDLLEIGLDGFTGTGSDLDLVLMDVNGQQHAASTLGGDDAEFIAYGITESETLYIVVYAYETGGQDITFSLSATIQ